MNGGRNHFCIFMGKLGSSLIGNEGSAHPSARLRRITTKSIKYHVNTQVIFTDSYGIYEIYRMNYSLVMSIYIYIQYYTVIYSDVTGLLP